MNERLTERWREGRLAHSNSPNRTALVTVADPQWVGRGPDGRTLFRRAQRRVWFVDVPDTLPISPETPRWHWWHEDTLPSVIQDAICRIIDDEGAHKLMVWERASWTAPRLRRGATEWDLPLDRAFLVQKHFATGGTCPPALNDWGVPIEVDSGVCLVFAWRLTDNGPAEITDPASVEEDEAITLSVEALFGLASDAIDDTGQIEAAPVIVSVALRASGYEVVRPSALTITRPAATQMVGCTADREGRFRGRATSTMERWNVSDGPSRPRGTIVGPALLTAEGELRPQRSAHDALHVHSPIEPLAPPHEITPLLAPTSTDASLMMAFGTRWRSASFPAAAMRE